MHLFIHPFIHQKVMNVFSSKLSLEIPMQKALAGKSFDAMCMRRHLTTVLLNPEESIKMLHYVPKLLGH